MNTRKASALRCILPLQLLETRTFLSAVTGFVYSDTNKNHQYDTGEGLPGIVVTFNNDATHNVSTPVTASDGSFATDIPAGTYHVTADGPGVTAPLDTHINIPEGDNVLKLAVLTDPITDSTTDLGLALSTPSGKAVEGVRALPIKATISNKGDTYTGPVTATVYFSTDKVIDSSDKALPPVTLDTVTIPGHKSYSTIIDATSFSTTLPEGKYYILAALTGVTDDSHAANDTAASKSALTLIAPVATPLPTVKARSLSKKDKTLPLILGLKNNGNATGTGTVAYSISARPLTTPPNNTGSADILLSSIPSTAFTTATKKSSLFPPTTLNLSALPAGKYQLVITATFSLTSPATATTAQTLLGPKVTIK